MRRPLGGFGLVMLVIVVAVVLWLAARAWSTVAPTAAEIQATSDVVRSPRAVPPDGSGSADRTLPSLGEMRERTAEHTDQVRDALADTP